MDIHSNILTLLNNLENSLICSLCNTKCKNPVRIKICGHYFCEGCLNNYDSHNCPKCQLFYEILDIDCNNIARESNELLLEIRNHLEAQIDSSSLNKCAEIETVPDKNSKEYTFSYKGERYRINFISCLARKLNAKGESLLHLACKRKKVEDVRQLVEQKVDINIKDYAGWVPLHEAVQSQNIEIVQILLHSGCLVNVPGADYITPLHQAVSLGNVDIIKLLLSYGADTNALDCNGLRPTDYPQQEGIKILLKNQIMMIRTRIYELFLPNNIVLYCHSIDEEYKKKLKSCCNVTIEEKIDIRKKLTHFVIKRTHKLSFKILQAMLHGLQFLAQDSIINCSNQDFFVNIPEYTFIFSNKSLNEGIRKSMISALLKLPKLFDGINFFIEDTKWPIEIYNLKVDKGSLLKLINCGGGNLLHRPPALRTCGNTVLHPYFASPDSGTYRCCNYIIYKEGHDPELMYNMRELQHKSSKWLIDCIVNFTILD
ncbi:BRCA1-associated RING domain protein 1-like [Cylas formicarius]|uniref:BRCA1-associated RING domain protein 1-like n=1 Tax=Cylas formicarius TaxID=197179 RepID=UPI0029585DF2|nr:BRCA1-associated RING domain protein 1-like [Cylas formicarius]